MFPTNYDVAELDIVRLEEWTSVATLDSAGTQTDNLVSGDDGMIYWQETYTTCYAEPRATVALRSQYRRGNTPLGLFTREKRAKNRKEASSPRSNSPPPPPPPPPNSPVRTTTYYNAADDHPTERSVVLAKGRAIKKWVGAACHGVFRTHRYVNVWDRAPLEVRVTKTQVEAVKYIDQ